MNFNINTGNLEGTIAKMSMKFRKSTWSDRTDENVFDKNCENDSISQNVKNIVEDNHNRYKNYRYMSKTNTIKKLPELKEILEKDYTWWKD